MMTSLAAMNIYFYIVRIYRSLGIFTAIFVWIYTSLMEIWKEMWAGVFFLNTVY